MELCLKPSSAIRNHSLNVRYLLYPTATSANSQLWISLPSVGNPSEHNDSTSNSNLAHRLPLQNPTTLLLSPPPHHKILESFVDPQSVSRVTLPLLHRSLPASALQPHTLRTYIRIHIPVSASCAAQSHPNATTQEYS